MMFALEEESQRFGDIRVTELGAHERLGIQCRNQLGAKRLLHRGRCDVAGHPTFQRKLHDCELDFCIIIADCQY
eukprot:COSAG02_NODE_10589_length_1905_cov_1.417497_2_plen_74_part_00